jgi:hypothetical protein
MSSWWFYLTHPIPQTVVLPSGFGTNFITLSCSMYPETVQAVSIALEGYKNGLLA